MLAKRGQITIFIILGIVMLLVVIGLIMLASNTKKEELKQAEEQVFSGAFKKEALRLGVEDCLRDDLDSALRLLGKQGTLWQGDPGGFSVYEEGKTGVLHPSGDRVAYGIALQEYEQYPEAYPCPNQEENPYFCQYVFPHPDAQYGARPYLTTSKIETAIGNFISQKTKECVKQIIESKISAGVEIVPGNLKTDVSIKADGINVKVDYPLTFMSNGKEFFQITAFDFDYPTPFFRFLQSVLTAVRFEQRYMEFELTNLDKLNDEEFEYELRPPNAVWRPPDSQNCELQANGNYLCEQKTFGEWFGETVSEAPAITELDNGDKIIEFRTNTLSPVDQQPYIFRIARQNRPPALDYVSRNACPNLYDYLVIPGEESELGRIDIGLVAQDPDEGDMPVYSFSEPSSDPEGDPQACGPGTMFICPIQLTEALPDTNIQSEGYRVEPHVIDNFAQRNDLNPNNIYILQAHASDGKKEDSQKIRILIDRPLILDVKLDMPNYEWHSDVDPALPGSELASYANVIQAQGNDRVYLASIEDPVMVNIDYPQNPTLSRLPQHLKLSYISDDRVEQFDYETPLEHTNADEAIQFALPWFHQEGPNFAWYGSQLVDGNSNDLIEKWKENVATPIPGLLGPDVTLEKPLSVFQHEGHGTLTLELDVAYCPVLGSPEQTSTKTVPIRVAGCIPHVNPEHPYPYPYQDYAYRRDPATGEPLLDQPMIQQPINPFEATHACCNPINFQPYTRQDQEVCFEEAPQLGCFGTADEVKEIAKQGATVEEMKGYILEEKTTKILCDGTRGNICNGEDASTATLPNRLTCANLRNLPAGAQECTKVAVDCYGQDPWTYQSGQENDPLPSVPGFWCNGPVGCGHTGDACHTEIVKNGPGPIVGDRFTENDYHCGCEDEDVSVNPKSCIAIDNLGLSGKCGKRRGITSCIPN